VSENSCRYRAKLPAGFGPEWPPAPPFLMGRWSSFRRRAAKKLVSIEATCGILPMVGN